MSKALSLHIGVNKLNPSHYAGWIGELAACEADAQAMYEIAQSQGYNSKLLLTDQATRQSVIFEVNKAASELNIGDIFFISYAGHGGQVRDINGDEDDLKDETWCLYDGQLIDDELNELWAAFNLGVRVLVISDSCHSGTVIRGEPDKLVDETLISGPLAEEYGTVGAKPRFMPTRDAFTTYTQNRSFYDGIQKNLPRKQSKINASVRLISGCLDNEVAMDGTFNGLFTGRLLQVWDNGNFSGNYSNFHSAIVQRMPDKQNPNHYVIGEYNKIFDNQKPFSTGIGDTFYDSDNKLHRF